MIPFVPIMFLNLLNSLDAVMDALWFRECLKFIRFYGDLFVEIRDAYSVLMVA